MDNIRFNCPNCEKQIDAPAELFGQMADCPGCGQKIQVPIQAPDIAPAQNTSGGDMRPCPYCGESILKIAIKCKHCGEFMIKQQTPAAPPVSTENQQKSEEHTFAMLCHLLAFSAFIFPLGGILGPLIVWLIKKDLSPFVDFHGRESLNFQISLLIYTIISVVLCLVFIGVLMLLALLIFEIVVVITAAMRANEGKEYRYPLCIRFL